MAEPMAMAEASGAIGETARGTSSDPIDRAVTTWTEDDVRRVMSSPAYLRSQHPQHREAQRMVRLWFEQESGTGPIAVDATGRLVRDRSGRKSERVTKDSACPVAVRAHTRDGGKVEVREHCRTKSA